MIVLAATSIWLGRNQSLYDFWFYITNFSRYPMEIYERPVGGWIRWVLHVPAADPGGGQRAGPHAGQAAAGASTAYLAGFAIFATVASFAGQPLGFSAGAVELPQREQLT